MMSNPLPPQFIILLGGLLIPFLKGKARLVYMLALPAFAFFNYLSLEEGIYWTASFMNFEFVFGRVDKISLIFLNVFIIVTAIAVIYNSHVKERLEHFSGFLFDTHPLLPGPYQSEDFFGKRV